MTTVITKVDLEKIERTCPNCGLGTLEPIATILDPDAIARILDATTSGDAGVNDCTIQPILHDLPFGGVGPSGMGSYHGIHGFRTFSHAKAVLRQPRIDVAKLAGIKPPYGKAIPAAIKRQIPVLMGSRAAV